MQETKTIREEQIFLAALELGPDIDRHEFLKQKCGDDSQLLGRVEELLEFHQRGDNILDDTSGGFWQHNLTKPDSVGVSSQIGPYKLLQEIGVGGMGVVYMAEQLTPVRRKVAVKIIKLGMDTRNVIARFEAERQALAMMDHPNITKVFDAGSTDSGRPYFVMELVTGLTITDYCDREKLSLRDRIKLFHQVCVGIKHAHQKGIIHRDLKPSNVMVTHYDGVAVPKIIDFGIAKAIDQTLTEKTLFTSYGNMIGTPEYMSPEQAEMSGQDIDTRADVYSLGVLMYELLTGTTPFQHWKKKGIHRFCEAVCHEEPELASTRVNNLANTVNEISRNRGTDVRSLRRTLRGDMDWILAKCMSKKRSMRYETAADLARDVQHYLDGQPIEAVGPNLRYKTRKFVRKHRASLSVASLILLTLVGATIVSTSFAIQAFKANRLANHRLLEVDHLRQEAEFERDRALDAESELEKMLRKKSIETATVRAAAKTDREKGSLRVRYPSHRDMAHNRQFVWKHEAASEMHFHSTQDHEHPPKEDIRQIQVVQVDSNNGGVESKSESDDQSRTFMIVIDDAGHVAVSDEDTSAINEFTFESNHDSSDHVVVTTDRRQARQFLKNLVDERREELGTDDEMVANAMIEIGNLSLRDRKWSDAENQFRESRDILLHVTDNDAPMAKVEMLIGVAQMHQEKIALAEDSLKNGVKHLVRLRQIPHDLVKVVEDIRQSDVPRYRFRDLMPDDLQKQLNERIEGIHEKVEIEIRTKK